MAWIKVRVEMRPTEVMVYVPDDAKPTHAPTDAIRAVLATAHELGKHHIKRDNVVVAGLVFEATQVEEVK